MARTGLRLLQGIQRGSLLLELPDGRQLRCGSSNALTASMRLRNWNVFHAVLSSGDIGLAESYIQEDWTTPHLADLFRLLLANRDALESLVYGSWLGRLAYRLRHLLRRNTKANSRKNIHAHYDLGNSFYQLWLDPSMNYSSAWFEGDLDGDFTQAQQAKVRRALRSVGIEPGQRLLEIGCGWGRWRKWPPRVCSRCGGRDAVHRAARLCEAAYGRCRRAAAGGLASAGLPRHL